MREPWCQSCPILAFWTNMAMFEVHLEYHMLHFPENPHLFSDFTASFPISLRLSRSPIIKVRVDILPGGVLMGVNSKCRRYEHIQKYQTRHQIFHGILRFRQPHPAGLPWKTSFHAQILRPTNGCDCPWPPGDLDHEGGSTPF